MKNSSRMPVLAAIALILTMALTGPWTATQESVLFAKTGSSVLTRLEEFSLSDHTAYYDRRPGGRDSGSPEEEAVPDAETADPDMEEASSESAAGEEEEEELDDGINNFSVKTARAEYDQVDETIIYTDDLTDAEKAAELTEMYLTLPESIRGTLEEYDCAIYLSGEANLEGDGVLSASGTEEAGETSAVYAAATAVKPRITYTQSDNRIISVLQAPYIVYYSIYDSDADTLIHEVGHVLDYIAGLRSGYVIDSDICALSSSEEWKEIYAADVNAIAAIDEKASINAGRNATECFAEAFRLAYTNPDALIAASPAAWNYVQQAVADITG